MRSRFLTPLLAVLVVLVAQLVTASPTFTDKLVEGLQLTGEPAVRVDRTTNPATIWVLAPEVTTQVWRSTDGGATFAHLAPTGGGGGDSDLAVDANGTVYVADLFDSTATAFSVPVSTSLDRGNSWARTVELAPGAIGYDRQWIAAEGNGHVVVTARNGGVISAWKSTDAATTFGAPVDVVTDAVKSGPLVFGPGGVLYMLYTTVTEVRIAKSTNGGTTWTADAIAPLTDFELIFPVVAIDDAGNLFAVWAQGVRLVAAALEGRVYEATSTDGGSTWTSPSLVSDVNRTSIFPWVSAGAAGKVAVAFYSARYRTIPDLGAELGGPLTDWDLEVSQSLDALSPNPTWTRSTAASGFHTGSMCTTGLSCPGIQQTGFGNVPTPFDRRDLDFFGMDVDPAGNLLIAYPKDRPFPGEFVGDLVLSWIDVYLAVQTGGEPLR